MADAQDAARRMLGVTENPRLGPADAELREMLGDDIDKQATTIWRGWPHMMPEMAPPMVSTGENCLTMKRSPGSTSRGSTSSFWGWS